MKTDPTHVIRGGSPSWCRPGCRVRLVGDIAPINEFAEVWAFCVYPDGKVRPVPAAELERIR